MKCDPESPTPWFTLNEVLLNWKIGLSVEFRNQIYLGNYDNLEKTGTKTLDHGLGNTKSNSKSLAPYFTSNEAIRKCQSQLRIEL